MQQHSEKTAELTKALGRLVHKLREKKNQSGRKFAYEYDITRGNLSKIENGISNCKFITIWRISEALGLKCSDFVRLLEQELGDDFKLMDE